MQKVPSFDDGDFLFTLCPIWHMVRLGSFNLHMHVRSPMHLLLYRRSRCGHPDNEEDCKTHDKMRYPHVGRQIAKAKQPWRHRKHCGRNEVERQMSLHRNNPEDSKLILCK